MRLIAQHGVEDRQKLTHARHEGDLGDLAGLSQSGIKPLQNRVVTHRREGGQIQHVTNGRTSTPHAPSPAQGAAVTIEWRDADQGGDLLAVELAQFGQTGDQGQDGDVPEPLDLAQQFGLGLPGGGGFHRLAQALLGGLQALLQPVDVGLDCLLYTSDAADERSSVDLGGRRIINKKKR